jgi:hypothetical protein
MRVLLVASAANQHEKDYRRQLADKIAAIGAEVIFWEGQSLTWPEAEVLAVLLDGRPLSALEWLRLGAWRQAATASQAWPRRIMVAYEYAPGAGQMIPLPDLFEHIANTERNFIYCLKDYIFFANRNGTQSTQPGT